MPSFPDQSDDIDIDDEMEEESEFWFFTDVSPLPVLEKINDAVKTAYPVFSISSKGKIEQLNDCLANGSIIPPGEQKRHKDDGIATAWMMEVLDARRFFAKAPGILKDLGPLTQMLKVTAIAEFSIGHVFSLLHALLGMRDGILAIPSPDDGSVMVFNRDEAGKILEEQLEEIEIQIDTESSPDI